MNYLRVCILLFVITSISLHAGKPDVIEKDGPAQKELQLTVAHKDNPQKQNTVQVTVSFKGEKLTEINLINGGKNVKLTPEVKDGLVTVSFEIEKTQVEKSMLNITEKTDTLCGTAYVMYLKGFII